MKTKEVNHRKMWAVFSPDGNVQVRTISYTKKEAKERTPKYPDTPWSLYERKGYQAQKIELTIQIVK